MTNGTGVMFENGTIKEITERNVFRNKYIVITRNLNFKSNASYINSQRTDFGDINENGENESLITELTTQKGFLPMSFDVQTIGFLGIFDGKNNSIKNLYINREGTVGLFGRINVNRGNTDIYEHQIIIKNLTISGNITGGTAGSIIGASNLNNIEIKIENCINEATINGRSCRRNCWDETK